MKKLFLTPAILFFAFVLRAQQLVQFSNAKITTSASTKVVIKGGVTFSGTSSLKDSGIIYIQNDPAAGRENWMDNVSGGVFHTDSRGTVVFNSSNQHQITGPGNFYTATVNADSGISFLSNASIRNQLNLDNGLVYISNGNKLTIDNPAFNALQSASNYSNSYVIGKLSRAATVTGSDYLFPIGKTTATDSLYAPVKLTKVSTTQVYYDAEYFPAMPTDRSNIMNPPIKDISDVEYWSISSNGSGTDDDAAISLSWRDMSHINPLASQRDSLLIAHYTNYGGIKWITENNLSFLNTVTGSSSFGFVTNNIANTNINNTYPYYTLAGQTPLVILPTQLISFTGTIDNKFSLLKWQVANNDMAAQYELLHAADNQHFNSIFKTNATSKQGMEFYTATHNQPLEGSNYYRLKITDKNGNISFSNTVKLNYRSEGKYKLYPNPADKFVNIQLLPGQSSVIRIFDSNGKLVAQKNTASSVLQVDITILKQGKYYAQISSNGKSVTLPFIKL